MPAPTRIVTGSRRRRTTTFQDVRTTRTIEGARVEHPERRVSDDLGSAFVPMSSLPTRAPAGLSTNDRVEPFFSDMWDGPASALFSSASRIVTDVREGRAIMDEKLAAKTQRRSYEKVWTKSAMRQLAATLMWRTITSEQMAAFSGAMRWVGAKNGTYPQCARDLWAYNFIHTGKAQRYSGEALPTIIRPGAFGHFDAVAQPLTSAQWLGVTGGVDPSAGSQATRHNVLTAELMLRIAEFTNVPAILGENACQIGPMTRTNAGNRRADAAFVREDGLIVAIETVATDKKETTRKVREWIEILRAMPDRSVAVVFVTATRDERTRPLFRTMPSLMANELLTYPGAMAQKIHRRMFTVDWSQWFRPGAIIEDFIDLPVLGLRSDATLSMEASERFERVLIGNAWETPWWQGGDVRNNRLMTGVHALYGMPLWMRDERVERDVASRLDAAILHEQGYRDVPALDFAIPTSQGRTRPDTHAMMYPGLIPFPTMPSLPQ